MSNSLILNSFFTTRPARGRYKPHSQYTPPLSVLAGLFVYKNLGGSFYTKRAAREKRGRDKRCGVMPSRTELNPRLLPTHLPSQLLFVGNSEPLIGPNFISQLQRPIRRINKNKAQHSDNDRRNSSVEVLIKIPKWHTNKSYHYSLSRRE